MAASRSRVVPLIQRSVYLAPPLSTPPDAWSDADPNIQSNPDAWKESIPDDWWLIPHLPEDARLGEEDRALYQAMIDDGRLVVRASPLYISHHARGALLTSPNNNARFAVLSITGPKNHGKTSMVSALLSTQSRSHDDVDVDVDDPVGDAIVSATRGIWLALPRSSDDAPDDGPDDGPDDEAVRVAVLDCEGLGISPAPFTFPDPAHDARLAFIALAMADTLAYNTIVGESGVLDRQTIIETGSPFLPALKAAREHNGESPMPDLVWLARDTEGEDVDATPDASSELDQALKLDPVAYAGQSTPVNAALGPWRVHFPSAKRSAYALPPPSHPGFSSVLGSIGRVLVSRTLQHPSLVPQTGRQLLATLQSLVNQANTMPTP